MSPAPCCALYLTFLLPLASVETRAALTSGGHLCRPAGSARRSQPRPRASLRAARCRQVAFQALQLSRGTSPQPSRCPTTHVPGVCVSHPVRPTKFALRGVLFSHLNPLLPFSVCVCSALDCRPPQPLHQCSHSLVWDELLYVYLQSIQASANREGAARQRAVAEEAGILGWASSVRALATYTARFRHFQLHAINNLVCLVLQCACRPNVAFFTVGAEKASKGGE